VTRNEGAASYFGTVSQTGGAAVIERLIEETMCASGVAVTMPDLG
jgi:hypothetical protein